jgi:hypothetical protein
MHKFSQGEHGYKLLYISTGSFADRQRAGMASAGSALCRSAAKKQQ